jgi:hypothetical protein
MPRFSIAIDRANASLLAHGTFFRQRGRST